MVIATALLTIIGMVGGYLLGQHRDRVTEPVDNSVPTPVVVATGPLCRKETQKMGADAGAAGELREVLKVRTARKTVVYICQDEAGRLYYHANKGGSKWIEGETALFLSNVWPTGEDSFTAEAWDGNTFSIDRNRLLITYGDGTQEEQLVVE
ncbi:hypothetical protein AB0M02_10380 [Actinoplanes sp. NPDC051861]|uniref:hypothetical protein n=1 Tax=Actinoplanes sp. NPDC051861 TaxID=3155170 RepID=UPI00342C4E28